jgi:hypothetical protein
MYLIMVEHNGATFIIINLLPIYHILVRNYTPMRYSIGYLTCLSTDRPTGVLGKGGFTKIHEQ